MKYALILEEDAASSRDTSALLSSMGYLIMPVFTPKKAIHAAHMIQFDLILTWTAINPYDRRCLTGELKRCSPDSTIILLADPESGPQTTRNYDGINALLYRPLSDQDLRRVLDSGLDAYGVQAPPRKPEKERRKRAIE